MKSKKYYQVIVMQIVFVAFAFLMFEKEQYVWTISCLVLLIIVNKLDTLKMLIFSHKDGIKAEFRLDIIGNIIENKEPVNESTYLSYKEMHQLIENRVFGYEHSRYSSSVKIHRNYSLPDRYIADIYIENPDGPNEIYEIKYVKSRNLAANIAKNAELQLMKYKILLNNDVKLRLVLASKDKIDVSKIKLSNEISIEYFKL